MRISQLKIENFRCFSDETICFDDYTCFVGPNGAGKSTVLAALNILFQETSNVATSTSVLSKEDFYLSNIARPVSITATFESLSPEAAKDFVGYFRNGKLIVAAVAEWDEQKQSATVMRFGERLGIEAFRIYFEKDKARAKAPELQALYGALVQAHSGLPSATTKPKMVDALHEYEREHESDCTPIRSEDLFYGVSKGSDRLQRHVQWVYVPAVKDASAEQSEAKNTAIRQLLERRVHATLNLSDDIERVRQSAVREYQQSLDDNKDALDEVSRSLNAKFKSWAHDGAKLHLDWADADNSVTIATPIAHVRAEEGDFKGSIGRFGHGLQRSFIFALLQELAEYSDSGPTLLLGCEEPELYQHPPQARYLAGVMQQLSTQNAQVMVSSHSPHFVCGRSFEQVRVVLKRDGVSTVRQATFEQVSSAIATATGQPLLKTRGVEAKIEQELQGPMNELFFATSRVLVEGLEDIAYVSAYLTLLERWQEFRSYGGHLVQAAGKHHLIAGIAMAQQFDLPTLVVFDCDGDTPEDAPEKPTGRRTKHERDNRAIFSLMGVKDVQDFPEDTIWRDNLRVSQS